MAEPGSFYDNLPSGDALTDIGRRYYGATPQTGQMTPWQLMQSVAANPGAYASGLADLWRQRGQAFLADVAGQVQAPGQVYRGELDPLSDEAIHTMVGLAGTAGGAGLAVGAERSAGEQLLGAGVRGKKGPAISTEPVFSRQGIDLAKPPAGVPQIDLPRYDPPRGTPEAMQEVLANPRVREQMLEGIQRGLKQGGDIWYNTEPLRQEFVKELGEAEGNQAYSRYMQYFSATSPRSDMAVNPRNASYYYALERQGLPMPAIGARNPEPYGHMAQRLHQQGAQEVAANAWDPLKNPKPPSFGANLAGNWSPVAVDAHAFKAPVMLAEIPRFLATSYKGAKDLASVYPQKMFARGEVSMAEMLQRPALWRAAPNPNEYLAVENYYKDLANELGIAPAQAQAGGWTGHGALTGLSSDASKSAMDFIEDRIRLTATMRNEHPRETLRAFIRGNRPLLSGGVPVPGQTPVSDEFARRYAAGEAS